MPAPVVLLPPSEGKSTGGRGRPWTPGSMRLDALDERRAHVAEALIEAMAAPEAARGKLLGVKGDALAQATAADLAVLTAPTRSAIDRYTGVLYDAFDHASLPAPLRRRAAAQVLVFSGLWGVVGLRDPIPDYKLKMGATLPGTGRLASWWRPAITDALRPLVAKRTVWDLLPGEHAAAWDPRAAGPKRRISVKFLDEVPDGSTTKLVVVSHWNKLLKGALVRHLLATQLDDADGLTEFDHPLGYRYRPELTTTTGDLTVASLVAEYRGRQ